MENNSLQKRNPEVNPGKDWHFITVAKNQTADRTDPDFE